MKKVKRLFLVSCDDGDGLDMDLARLLLKYKIPAVFYIPAPGFSDLQTNQIRCLAGVGDCELSEDMKGLFEIGGHTNNHPVDLKKLDDKDLKEEIESNKEYLEIILGKKITKFCYPKGKYDERVKKFVKKAGFKEARNVNDMSIEFPKNKFDTRPTVHVYPNHERYGGLVWKELAEQKLDEVLEDGGRFELWMHSWEVEKYNQWEFLEDFLSHMDDKLKEINYPRKVMSSWVGK